MSRVSYQSAMLAELKRDRFVDLDDNFDTSQQGQEPPLPPTVLQECIAAVRERLKSANNLAERIQGLQPLGRAMAYYLAPERYFPAMPPRRSPGESFSTTSSPTSRRGLCW